MAITCCDKEYAEICEIGVFVDAPAPHNPGLYSRLRFDLLTSSWFPRPLGIFLWSALHVMFLIVGGPAFWVLRLLTAFLFYTFVLVTLEILICLSSAMVGLYAVGVDLVFFLVESIRFCWSLVCFLACHEPIVEWKGPFCVTVELWEEFKDRMSVNLGECAEFCTSGSSYVYEETKDRQLQTWARWCEEVVHKHEAIAL